MSNKEFIVFRASANHYQLDHASSNPYDDERVKSIDQMLHRTLVKIFNELSLNTGKMKDLLCRPKDPDQSSIFKLILVWEPALSEFFSKNIEFSLLWIAVLSCYQESAELLVRSGADVNELYGLSSSSYKLSRKTSILHALIQMYPSAWNERFISLVIDHGADFEARDSDDCGCTALNLAVECGRVKLTEMLLEKGADVDATTYDEMTPLLEAAHNEITGELLSLLMRHGSDVTARVTDGCNVLHHLAFAPVEHVDLARVLIEKGASVEDGDSVFNLQPLHEAIIMGKNGLVNVILDYGVNANALREGFNDEFPLYIAAQECNDPAVLLTLFKHGADIDMKNEYGETALYGLIEHQSFYETDKNTTKKLKILLSLGANMFTTNNDGVTIFDSIERRTTEDPNLRLILRTLALRKIAGLQPSIELKYERLMEQEDPNIWEYFQKCIEEINRMKFTNVFKSCSVFEILIKCQCELELHMRYNEFRRRFRLVDLSNFRVYVDDINEAFERAERYYNCVLDQENLINEALYKFCEMFVRKMARYIVQCEACKLRTIVNASRKASDSSDATKFFCK